MIINEKAIIRRAWANSSRIEGHLHEGKYANLTASGEIAIATSATDIPNGGVVSEPDGQQAYSTGYATGASLILPNFGGIVQVQVGSSPGEIKPGTRLKLLADGRMAASAGTAGDIIVATSLEGIATTTGKQLIAAVLVNPYKI